MLRPDRMLLSAIDLAGLSPAEGFVRRRQWGQTYTIDRSDGTLCQII